ncbi:MAG: sel1 repeat family protein [Candidatus Electrothrix sp. GM3_4]|nr:sel1 repeat family protein [Candidatus Electrothrix sp. GM3_4]
MDKSGDVFQDLEALLDRVTPLYKHRMDDLKPQQQAIIDVIALSWDGIGTGEIVKRLKGRRFDNKKVSAQLAALTKNDLVSSRTIGKKDKIYFIRERFFNIWYLMRLGRRKNGDRVLWLVRFLQDWYSPKELVDRSHRHIDLACKGELNTTGAYFMAEALSRTVPDMELQHELLEETRNFLFDKDRQLAESLSMSDKSNLEKARKAFETKKYQVSIRHLKQITSHNLGNIDHVIGLNYSEMKQFDNALKYYLRAIEKGSVDATFNLGLLYGSELKNFDKAVTYYQMAVDMGDAHAMFNLANLYADELKNNDKAIICYQMAIDKGITHAIFNLGLLYQDEMKDFDKAITCYQQAVSTGHVGAMINLGLLYESELKDFDKAITYYKMAMDIGDTGAMINLGLLHQNKLKDFDNAISYYQMAVHKGDTRAMINLGLLYQNGLNDFDNAIAYYQMAVNKGDAGAMINLGYLYDNKLKDFDNAIAYYQMAVHKGDARAMNNLGYLYDNELKDFDNAISYYQMAVHKGDTRAMINLGLLYQNGLNDFDNAIAYYQMAVNKGDAGAMINLGYLYDNELKDFDNAISYYQMAVNKGDARAMNNLGYLYDNKLKDFDNAIAYYQMAVDKGGADEGDIDSMFNLGLLYDNELNDFDKAVTYYQMAADKGDTDSMNELAWLYFELNQVEQQKKALALIQRALAKKSKPHYRGTLANLLLWKKDYDGADHVVRELLSEDAYQDMLGGLIGYLIFLIAQEQLHTAHKLFLDFPQLQDEIKPVYYALMTLLKDEYPKEHLRMGEELETTVEEILNKAEEMREKYGE